MKKKRVFSPQLIGRGYDKVTPLVLKQMNINDSFLSFRTEPLDIIYDHIISTLAISDKMRVLDAGCGIGGPSMYFAKKRDVEIEAINISKVQVEIFKKKITEQNLEGKINVTHGDYHMLHEYYPVSHFDVVIFLESFGHAIEPAKVLSSVWKVLKEGGILYIHGPMKTNGFNLLNYRRIKKSVELLSNHYGYKFNSRRELCKLLRVAKFRDIKINELVFPNSNLNLIFQYESIAGLNYYGRGKCYKFFGINYYFIHCLK